MTGVCNCNLPCQIKLSFFNATVAVLFYGGECCTLTLTLQKSLDGYYNRMLRAVLDISSKTHGYQQDPVYEEIPKVNEKLALRRMRLTGLPKASRAAGQQTGAVGTNAWTSVTRTSHANVRGHTREG